MESLKENSLGFWLALFFWLPLSSHAQTILDRPFNNTDIFSSIETCDEYLEFLEGDIVSDYDECHQIARFLIENDPLEFQEYLDKMIETVPDRSGLGLNARLAKSLFYADFIDIKNAANLAAMRAAIGSANTTDVDRSFVYLHLIREISNRAVVALCADPILCQGITSGSILSDSYGDGMARLNSYRPDILFYCLLKIDGYLTPIETVLSSKKYDDCISQGE